MLLDLHEEFKKRLVDVLEKSLPKIDVKNGMFLTSASRATLFGIDDALPNHGPLKEKLSGLVGEFPLMTFVSDILQTDLLELDKYRSDAPLQSLTEIEGFMDARLLAERLVGQVESLPWRYTFTIEMPREISNLLSFISDEQLSPNLRLVKASKAFDEKYPINSENEKRQIRIHAGGGVLFPKAEQATWVEDAVYLQIEIEGFIGPFGGSASDVQAERVLKSFLGLGCALRLFRVDRSYSVPSPIHFYIHRADGLAWKIEMKLALSADLSRTLSEIKLHPLITDAEDEARRLGLSELILREMKAVFAGGPATEPVTLSAEWLLDSYGGTDERLSYVQAMVVLEVLLGDKAAADEIGLGQLLRNRCAYLIGRNQAERALLIKEFDEIYKVRSQIVHRGKAGLSFKERLLFSKLHEMCRRVIQREVDLLRTK